MLPILMLAVLLTSPKAVLVPMEATDPRLHLLIDDARPEIVVVKDDAGKRSYIQAVQKCDGNFVDGRCLTLQDLDKELEERSKEDEKDLPTRTTNDISHIYFTSGSTGRPKGCISTHAALTSYCLAKISAHNITSSSVIFVASSHTFDPSFGDFISTLIAGATIAVASRTTTFTSLSQCLSATKATHVLTTPALFTTMQATPKELSNLQVVALGGEPTPQSIISTWAPQITLINTYGVTECCVYQAISVLTPSTHRKSIGEPLPGNEILIMTPESGSADQIPYTDPLDMRPVQTDSTEIGEIWIAGKQVGLGYLNRPELTAQRFIMHPIYGRCFRTGDVVTAGKDGYKLLGRLDSQVKIRGQRIEVEEIEHVIVQSLTNTVVSSVTVVYHCSKQLVAFVVPNEFETFGGDKEKIDVLVSLLRRACEEQLPSHMVPSRFVIVGDLPRTGTGKVARSVLAKEELPNVEDLDSEDEETFGGWREVVVDVWMDVLGVPRGVLGNNSNFVERGGDSLRALRVCKLLSEIWMQRSGRKKEEEDGGIFGEELGVFQPGELLKRKRLGGFARYLRWAMGDFTSENAGASNENNKSLTAEPNSNPTPCELDFYTTVLYTSSSLNLPTILSYLLTTLKLSPNPSTTSSTTPLHLSTLNSHLRTTAILLSHSASATTQDSNSATPLHLASHDGPLNLVKTVLEHMQEQRPKIKPSDWISKPDNDGQTVLHHACRNGAPSNVITFLIETSPATLTKKDKWGRTPLHWAVVNGHRSVVETLMEYGADMKEQDAEGESAVDIAERRARCGASERGDGVGASLFGGIARVLGGSGRTGVVARFKEG